jgi:phosphoglucomutase
MSAERATKKRLTENICNMYAEIFRGADHLRHILEEVQAIVNDAFAVGASPGNGLRKEHD